jgi:hypothetical protein
MRVDHAGGGVEAGVGNPPNAGVAVVVGHILEEPINGVVEIGAVVDVLVRPLEVEVRSHFDELALR